MRVKNFMRKKFKFFEIFQRAKRDIYSWQKYDKILSSEEAYEKKMTMIDSNDDDCIIDWWSKYYSSIGESEKAPGYAEYFIRFKQFNLES